MNQQADYRDRFVAKEEAAKYDANYQSDSYANILFEIEKKYLLAIIGKIKRTHAEINSLDFACGTGRITEFIEKYVDFSEGLDISESMLQIARKKAIKSKFFYGDITNDPMICPGPYDLVTAFRFVTNAQSDLRMEALKALSSRMERSESLLVFNVHRCIHSYLFFHWLFQKVFPFKNDHDWHYMSRHDARKLASQSKLKVDRIIGFGFLSSHIAKLFSHSAAFNIEYFLSRIPGIQWFGSEFIVVCHTEEKWTVLKCN